VTDLQEYTDTYYEFSRPDRGLKQRVDVWRDALIRRQILSRVDGGRLLDVGCGIGAFLESMQDEFELWGLDLSEYAISRCHDLLPAATLGAGSLSEGIPWEVTYDAITAINVFEHLSEPRRAAQVLRRHVRPGGLLIAHLPTIGNPVQAALYRSSYDQDPTHVYRPSGGEFAGLVESAGFRTVWASYAPFAPAPMMRYVPLHPAFMAVFEAVTPPRLR
jgi:SAM-dependent methyltransferase